MANGDLVLAAAALSPAEFAQTFTGFKGVTTTGIVAPHWNGVGTIIEMYGTRSYFLKEILSSDNWYGPRI